MDVEKIKNALMSVITTEMIIDDEPEEKKAERLVNTYQNASNSEKAVINDLFITLTGWSLESLAEKAENFYG